MGSTIPPRLGNQGQEQKMTNHPNRNLKYSQRVWLEGGSMWGDSLYTVGEVGFLIETSPQQRANSYSLGDRPAHTNQSNEPRIYGWCGSWNNTSTSGCGIAQVLRVAKNGRVQVGVLTDCKNGVLSLADEAHRETVQKFLDETGYADEFDFSEAPVTA